MAKKKEAQLQTIVSSREEWDEIMELPGLTVVDIHQAWCGPCKAVRDIFTRLKMELGDELLRFITASTSIMKELESLRGRCEPLFHVYAGGEIVALVHGADLPMLESTILEQLEAEKKLVLTIEPEVQHESEEEDEYAVAYRSHFSTDLHETSEQLACTKLTAQEVGDHPYAVAIIKPDVVAQGDAEELVVKMEEAGLEVKGQLETTLTEEQVKQLYSYRVNEVGFMELLQFMTSGPSLMLALSSSCGEGDAISVLQSLIGPSDPSLAQEEQPMSLRAQYGTDSIANAVHGSTSITQAAQELALLFPSLAIFGKRQVVPLEKTLAIIRPQLLHKKDMVLMSIREADFIITLQMEVVLSEEQVLELYKDQEASETNPELVRSMTSGPSLVLALAKENGVMTWRDMLGPADINEAKVFAPNCLRAQFTVDGASINQLHGSADAAAARVELQNLFNIEHTIVVVTPDGYKSKDEIVKQLQEAGFDIGAMETRTLDRDTVAELWQHQEAAEGNFEEMLEATCQGPSLVVLLSREDAINKCQHLVGPANPTTAQEQAPGSLRAQFGQSSILNAVYCPQDKLAADSAISLLFVCNKKAVWNRLLEVQTGKDAGQLCF
uniref:thioredoxin domain-containing protein 6-like isoform X2 n=1 Tax=Myxine glutinosa TaxID=7769 RepID=UPI00358E07B2